MKYFAITKKLIFVMGTRREIEGIKWVAQGTHHIHANKGQSRRIKAGTEGLKKVLDK